uniref:Uncharacterized protein n=1 Tax=Arundo donax TaxID=35708 RepID=A0A0A9E8Q0_ARUDO
MTATALPVGNARPLEPTVLTNRSSQILGGGGLGWGSGELGRRGAVVARLGGGDELVWRGGCWRRPGCWWIC